MSPADERTMNEEVEDKDYEPVYSRGFDSRGINVLYSYADSGHSVP